MENEHGIANIVVVNNVVQNPMTSTPTPGKIQTLKIKVRVYVIFFTKTLIFVYLKRMKSLHPKVKFFIEND